MHRFPLPNLVPALLLPLLVAVSAAGCSSGSSVEMDENELESYVRAMMPQRVEIEPFTKPVSFNGSGDADGLEVILAALDKLNDPTKVAGTFQFELHTFRKASSDPLGRRVAFWPLEIKSDESFLTYWDRLARFYRFPLKLETAPLAPGQYILSARVRLPTGETLFDEYEFTHSGGAVPTVAAGK